MKNTWGQLVPLIDAGEGIWPYEYFEAVTSYSSVAAG